MGTATGGTNSFGPQSNLLSVSGVVFENDHPDFVAGRFSDGDDHRSASLATNPIAANPGAMIIPTPDPLPLPLPIPNPIPVPQWPIPRDPRPLPAFCMPVSGRYVLSRPQTGGPFSPTLPINLFSMTIRIDVDRFYPQNRISIEVSRMFPSSRLHLVAEVTSDVCSALNRRIITANISYREGNAALLVGNTLTFRALRTTGVNYGAYELEVSGGGTATKTYPLTFESIYFDSVEFEVDVVDNAGTTLTAYDTGTHPNRPAALRAETLSLVDVYNRAGFDARMSPRGGVIPSTGAGGNGTWSDAEMHNAMVAYWSRFGNTPNWAMWVLYAAQHDQGRSLGGVMFDDIGPQHRQGTAIFTDSFIQDAPAGDPNPAAWRNRMQFWTAIHEMGHAFNLAHSWQKSLGTGWVPLANEPEARSFMNYPYSVAGGQARFFSDFHFRFSDAELVFMRHAPRRFVQMGNSNWFDNHGFEAPESLNQSGAWQLEIRPNRRENTYRFLEPVTMELKLSNTSGGEAAIEKDLLAEGCHVSVFVQRQGGSLRQLKPMINRCHKPHSDMLGSGESIYGAHMISTSTDGWLIDEPGFYKVQAAVDMGGEIVVSNVLRLYVAPPISMEEGQLGGDFFTEDVGRLLAFAGAPELSRAEVVLRRILDTCSDNPAAVHASMAIYNPLLRNFKRLAATDDGKGLRIEVQSAKVDAAAKSQLAFLLKDPNFAADSVGHIRYFDQLQSIAKSMRTDGDEKGAVDVLQNSIALMKSRGVLTSVIARTEKQISGPV